MASFPNTQSTQRDHYEGNSKALWLRSNRVATLIGGGHTISHPTKEEQDCTLFNQFREVNKRLGRKPFPIPKISAVLQELTRRVHICNDPWSKHGLLHHKFGSGCVKDLHHHFSLGKVLLQETTHGNSRLSQHIPGENVQLNGNPLVCLILLGWSPDHHKREPGRPLEGRAAPPPWLRCFWQLLWFCGSSRDVIAFCCVTSNS